MISMLLWMAIYVFGWNQHPYALPAQLWHAHEMVYGYALAVIAGFLLTAIHNWTGQQTLQGIPLLGLFITWLAARVLPWFDTPIAIVAFIDCLFLFMLVLSAAQLVIPMA